jgi:glycosyltransferase involved in cell wall biosynthesis
VRVLFVNHTSVVSGAEHSLLTLMEALSPDLVAGLACPDGPLADVARSRGIDVHLVRGVSGGLRLRPQYALVAGYELMRSGVELADVVRRTGADIVHANSVRAGLISGLACRIRRRGLVVHIRDCLPESHTTKLIRRRIARDADQLVAVSEYVAARFRTGLPGFDAALHVIDNPVDLRRFRPMDAGPSSLGTRPLLVVGQITPWKGHDTVIHALQDIQLDHPGMQLHIVGAVKFAGAATRLDNPAYLGQLNRLVEELELGASVKFLGERDDVPDIMARAAAVLVPSWEEPFGRTVAEAMAVGTPVVATNVGGPAELIDDGVTGLLVPPGEPARWSAAVGWILGHPERAHEMSRKASVVAHRRFAPNAHSAAMLAVYASLRRGARSHAR